MKKHLSFGSMLPMAVLLALLFAAIHPGLVFAEGEAPETLPAETSSPDTTEQEGEIINAVEQLSDANAVIVDQNGAAVPLASHTALEALCDPDPWFYGSLCSGGICRGLDLIPPNNDGFLTLQEALDSWVAKKGYGMIYLEGNYIGNTNTITINGTIAGMSTLKGIVRDTTSIGDVPVLQGGLYIQNFTAGFILRGFKIVSPSGNGIYMAYNAGTIRLTDITITNSTGSGIYIYGNKGSIILERVSATGNRFEGSYLSNQYFSGATEISTGNITIINSEFLRNGWVGNYNSPGLSISSKNSILINGVTSSGNNGNGLNLGVDGTVIIKNSVFSNNTADPDNSEYYGFGIYTYSGHSGSITLDNVILMSNENGGALLSTTGNIILKKVSAISNHPGIRIATDATTQGAGAKNVTITDVYVSKSTLENLTIYASGSVTITNLISTQASAGTGLIINNTYATTPLPVTLNNVNLSDNGSWLGGYVESKGTITVNGVNANGNGLYGLQLKNDGAGSSGNIVVIGTLGKNIFDGNSTGLWVQTSRNVSLSTLQSNGNSSQGIIIEGAGTSSNVILSGVEALNNGNQGINISTTGTVTISKTVASGNTGTGLYIDNDSAITAKSVLISNSIFNNNLNFGYGIQVLSVGTITLSGVIANENGTSGALLNNSVISLVSQLPQAVSVSKSTFNGNAESGLRIYSQRKITLSYINAIQNTGFGIYAQNTASTVMSPIAVSGTIRVMGNSFGINLQTNGIATASGIASIGNINTGISISSGGAVTLLSSQTSGNGWWGLFMTTKGNTILNGLTIMQNGYGGFDDHGAQISVYTGKLYIYNSTIAGNSGYGLYVDVVDTVSGWYLSPNTIFFGNDAGTPYDDGNYYFYH
jgi:hypothetical protein